MEKRPFTFDEAEYRLRRLLAEEGYAQPDVVRESAAQVDSMAALAPADAA